MPKKSLWFIAALCLVIPIGLFAQGGGRGGGGGQRGGPGGPPAGPQNPKTAAPVDLTGYWVSIVTEDWIERMSPDSPPSGTNGGRGAGRGAAPVAPPPNGEQCRVYGAGGSMRVPTRLHVTWADDNNLKVEMDAGTQTRLLHFNSTTPIPAEKTLQGYSVATWETGARGGGRGGFGGPAAAAPRWGSLNVTTTNMTSGYLLSSRSVYSDNAVLTEYFSHHRDFGQDYFTVTAQLQDGARTIVTSSTFKKEPDGMKFSPGPCEIVR